MKFAGEAPFLTNAHSPTAWLPIKASHCGGPAGAGLCSGSSVVALTGVKSFLTPGPGVLS